MPGIYKISGMASHLNNFKKLKRLVSVKKVFSLFFSDVTVVTGNIIIVESISDIVRMKAISARVK